MQSVFVNLGLATFRWIKDGKTKGDSRERLLTVYDACALNALHDEITIDDFTQLTQKYRNQRQRKKRDFSEVNRSFVAVEQMPKKDTPCHPVDHRSRPLDSFDETEVETILDVASDEEQEEAEERIRTTGRRRKIHLDSYDGALDFSFPAPCSPLS